MSAFNAKQRTFRHRNVIPVTLRLLNSEEFLAASIFTCPGERASDLLNDARTFIPIRLASGETMIIAKSQIASIVEHETTQKPKEESKIDPEELSGETKPKEKTLTQFDAYAALRVKPSASNEEIRAAYKARIKAVHPDRLSALGLDEEIANAAVLAAQKVNYAYQKIMRERGLQPHIERVA